MLALLYDVHGNLPALEAVLDEARAAGAERHVVGGDVALFGPWPGECLELLRTLPDAAWLRGNTERWLADRSDAPPFVADVADWTAEQLGRAAVEDLLALPFAVVDGGTRYVHASPVSDMRSFAPVPGAEDDELLAGLSERRLVFGHTHLPFRRTAATGVELVNPGSVGMPLDGDVRAAWALVHDDGEIELRRTDYDHARTVAAVESRFGAAPFTVRFAQAKLEGS